MADKNILSDILDEPKSKKQQTTAPSAPSSPSPENVDSFWDIFDIPEDDNSNIPLENGFYQELQIEPYDVINQSINSSKETLSKIRDYLVEQKVPTLRDDDKTDEQYFEYENIRYCLNKEEHIEWIHHEISRIKEAYDHTIKKHRNVLKDLKEKLKPGVTELKHPAWLLIDEDFILTLIVRVLGINLQKVLLQTNIKKEILYTNSLSETLGMIVLDAIMHKIYLYYDMTQFNVKDKDKDIKETKSKIYEFAKEKDQDLLKVLEYVEETILNNNQIKKKTKKNVAPLGKEFGLDVEIMPEILKPLRDHLKLHCIRNNIIDSTTIDNKTQETLNLDIKVFARILGLEALTLLKKVGVVKELIDNKKVPYLQFNEDYEISLVATSSFNRP